MQVEETAAESVKISPSGPFTLNIGETVALSAEVLPETATDKSVTWRSQTEAVSVDADGLVTALAPVENNRIVATNSNGQTDYVYVTVLPTPVKSIVVDKTVVVLRVGGSETVSATVLPEDATDKGISWSSYNTAVASVDNAGKITAVSIGETDIRAVAADGSGVTATVHVSVIATPVESVAISADGGTILKDGETLQLVATVLPADATDRTVTWKSDAPSRASVDANGLVSAHAETGIVMISATAGDMTSSITLTIAETPVESISIISLGSSSAEIIHGGTLQLSAEVLPVTATDRSVRWHVSDASVISVDGNGLVTALSPGEAYVYAETAGGIKASQHVVVKPVLVERIVIPEKVTLGTGEEYRFWPEIYPDNASIRTLRWTVTESAVGTMSGDDGVFHAVTKGSTKVVCSATDGSGVSQTCEIEVIKRVTSVRLSEHDLKLSLPGEMQLQADVEPIDASDRRVEWQSSRPDVAEVSQVGLITAISEGEAVISATSMSDSECRDECGITIVKEESGISAITVDDIRIRVGEGIITVENLPAGYKVSVCDLSGRILQSDCGGRENVTFYVPTGMVYVVSVGGHAIKVVV